MGLCINEATCRCTLDLRHMQQSSISSFFDFIDMWLDGAGHMEDLP